MTDYEAWVVAYLVLIGIAEVDTLAPLAVALAWATAIGYWFWLMRSGGGTSTLRQLIPQKGGTTT